MNVLSLTLMRRARTETQAPSQELLESLCRRDIYRYALRRLDNPQDAEDAAGEVFVAALESRPPRGVEPRLWLLGIARRKVADQLRRRMRRPETGLSDAHLASTPGPEDDALQAEANRRMRQLVLALPDAQREALLLQAADGLAIAEIAAVMGRSPSSVNSLLGRARETLRRTGASYFEEETP